MLYDFLVGWIAMHFLVGIILVFGIFHYRSHKPPYQVSWKEALKDIREEFPWGWVETELTLSGIGFIMGAVMGIGSKAIGPFLEQWSKSP